MRVTIHIPSERLREAKCVAARERTTVGTLIEEGLRYAIAQRGRASAFRLRKATFKGEGLSAEAARIGWDRLRDFAYKP